MTSTPRQAPTGAPRRARLARSTTAAACALLGAALGLGACQKVPDKLPSRGITVPPPDQSIFLRASFDDDPSTYIGRFLPDQLSPSQIDENEAMATRCSAFITHKEIKASGTYDEYYNASTNLGLAVGSPGLGGGNLGVGDTSTVRVRYDLTRKMRAEIADQAGFDQCCAAAPDQCPDFIIGEFFFGTGHVFQAVGAQSDFDADGVSPTLMAEVDFKDEVVWKRQSNFDEVYFAFRKQRVRNASQAASADPDDCSWANNVPSSLDGKFFVGVSSPATNEADARDLAMRNARAQVVRFLGEYITSASITNSSAVEGYLQDEKVITAVAEALVSRVKDQRWCPAETLETPKGLMFTTRVLAFFPEADKKEAAREALKVTSSSLKAEGRLDAATEAAINKALGALQ